MLVAPAAAMPLSDARWLAPGADRVAALTRSPGECYRAPQDDGEAYLAEIGRVAFRSPLALGGQAARAGLSCASCHVDGRSNPDFFFEGLSDAPGTADVTTSIFSERREDGVFNPIAIPSLLDAGAKSAFGTAKPATSLHGFIDAALVDEFSATPPPAAVLDGLVAYVKALRTDNCPQGEARESARRDMRDLRRAIAAAERASRKVDRPSADFLLASAQVLLGRVNERYPAPDAAPLRESLADLSRALASARALQGEPQAFHKALASIDAEARALERRLRRAESASLYHPPALELYLRSASSD